MTKFEKAHYDVSQEQIALWTSQGASEAVIRGLLDDSVYLNDTYQVAVRSLSPDLGMRGWVHLSVKRLDREPVRDWRDMQSIKNELVGPEREAVELYPAESRLVDGANQFHLWVAPEGVAFPFGFQGERMTATPDEAEKMGAKQR